MDNIRISPEKFHTWRLRARRLDPLEVDEPEPEEDFDVPLCLVWRAERFFEACQVIGRLDGREAMLERLEGRAR